MKTEWFIKENAIINSRKLSLQAFLDVHLHTYVKQVTIQHFDDVGVG